MEQGAMAHIYSPSYSESRDQQDLGLRQAQKKCYQDPYLN
jgi:hypothetical protein